MNRFPYAEVGPGTRAGPVGFLNLGVSRDFIQENIITYHVHANILSPRNYVMLCCTFQCPPKEMEAIQQFNRYLMNVYKLFKTQKLIKSTHITISIATRV